MTEMPYIRRLALLACLLLCAVPAHAVARPHLLLGVQDDALLTSGEPEAWPSVASLHPGVIRYNVAWDAVAPTRPADPRDPGDPAYDWSKVDAMAVHVAELGAAPVFTIVQSPRWANGGVDASHAPTRASDFGAFCAAVAKRYSGGFVPAGADAPLPEVDRYTVWNEPNRLSYLAPQGKDGRPAARVEAALVNACLPNVHQQNWRARVALGPLASRGEGHGLAPLAFLAAYRHAGGKRPDAIALNPYLWGLAPQYAPHEVLASGAITLRNLDQLQGDVRRAWHVSLPVWLTEFAFRVGDSGRLGPVTAARQASLARQSIDLVRMHYPYVQLLVWFLVRDQSADGYWRSGMLTFGWAKKPLYRVWASASRA
jgi:hypothetical protein